MRDFRSLRVWQAARALAVDVVTALSDPAVRARFRDAPGLRDQAIRAATSIPTNIAEGCGTASLAEFRRFLDIAARSASELESVIHLTTDLAILPLARGRTICARSAIVRRMLKRLSQNARE